MSDLLRKLLYPLVLPCLVTAVWGYAWTKKYDHQTSAGSPVVTFPAPAAPSAGSGGVPPRHELNFVHHLPPGGALHTFVSTEDAQEE